MPKEQILNKSSFLRDDLSAISFSHLDEKYSKDKWSYIQLEENFSWIKDDVDTLSALIEVYFEEQMSNLKDDDSATKAVLNEQQIRWMYYCYACYKFLEAERTVYHANPEHRDVKGYQKSAQAIKDKIQSKITDKNHRDHYTHNLKIIADDSSQPMGPLPRPGNSVLRTLKELIDDTRKALKKALDDMKEAPLTETKNWISWLNMYRIFWVFIRITTTNLLLFLREIQFFDVIERSFHKIVTEKQWIARMTWANIITNFLSVGYYLVRSIMNLSSIIKHTWLVSEAIKNEENSSFFTRLKAELLKRHNQMLNDGLWGVVNGLTNYAWLFHFGAWFVNYLTIAFLAVDFVLVLEGYFVVTRQRFQNSIASIRSDLELASTEYFQSLVNQQIHELQRQWNAALGATMYQSAAAAMFVGAFTAACFLGTPLMGFVLFGVCVLAISMYLTTDIATKLFKSILDYKALGSDATDTIKKENIKNVISKHSKDLLLSILERTLLPVLTIALFVAFWQAGLVLAVAYISYKIYSWHQQNHPKGIVEDKTLSSNSAHSENTARSDSTDTTELTASPPPDSLSRGSPGFFEKGERKSSVTTGRDSGFSPPATGRMSPRLFSPVTVTPMQATPSANDADIVASKTLSAIQ